MGLMGGNRLLALKVGEWASTSSACGEWERKKQERPMVEICLLDRFGCCEHTGVKWSVESGE